MSSLSFGSRYKLFTLIAVITFSPVVSLITSHLSLVNLTSHPLSVTAAMLIKSRLAVELTCELFMMICFDSFFSFGFSIASIFHCELIDCFFPAACNALSVRFAVPLCGMIFVNSVIDAPLSMAALLLKSSRFLSCNPNTTHSRAHSLLPHTPHSISICHVRNEVVN